MLKPPTFKLERELIERGCKVIVGVDEAGAGALAGPVVAAAAALPLNSRLGELRDSKLMSAKKRQDMYDMICAKSGAWAIGIASVEEIGELGLRPANLLAMRRAVDAIENVDHILVDAWTIPDVSIPQTGIVRGDQTVKSIAAASVLAKVTRDWIMMEHATTYPEYGFDQHKGYATESHREAIEKYGPCEIHRINYKIFQQTLI
jgi:ribonuclease HII